MAGERDVASKRGAVFLTGKELADRWGVSIQVLGEWRKEGRVVPFYKFGHQYRYLLDDVVAVERSRRNEVTPSGEAA